MKLKSLLLLQVFLAATAFSDEGMWLFNEPPREILKKTYNFDATDEWLQHLQKSSVRFNSGGSGSFVSEDGLLITNQHVGADALQKLSTQEKDYVHDGFRAMAPSEEIKCLDLELNVLQSIEDVTDRVNAAVPKKATPEKAFLARRKAIADIEKESLDSTGLRSNVITLWKGGAYHLYRFKRYTDVRLVFAPEQQISFFGGDPDNFEFPREDLDICLLRAYEDGKPAKVKDYLKFSPTGVKDGDLVFVSGHPGHTNRLFTTAEMISERDLGEPYWLRLLNRKEVLFASWAARSDENARRVQRDLFGTQNSRKRDTGALQGLLDPAVIAAKADSEAKFKAALAGKPEYREALAAFGKIEAATHKLDAQMVRTSLLEGAQAFNCQSFRTARTLLRAGDEHPKPNGDRLREFSDSEKASLELSLFSEKPVYADLEILKLADSLTFLASILGADDLLVKKVLAGKSPTDRAAELINGTQVRDVAFRKKLYDGGAKVVAEADDPMIELARLVDAESRALRKVSDEQEEILEQGHAAIEQARHKLSGGSGYPDATFTLRLAFGTVKGVQENGKEVPPITTFGSLYEKSEAMKDQPPYNLPPLWKQRRYRLDMDTPFNFISTCDIIGGNSGSPVVNANAEFVGIIFDGNLQSLTWGEVYSDRQGRAVSVHSAGILQALDRVYEMKDLVKELKDGKRP